MNTNSYKITGINGAFIVLFIFFGITTLFHHFFNINSISYYWLSFTVLTGIWEYIYITNRKYVSNRSLHLLDTKTHVWFTKYNINMILPWNTSYIFYSEYGAYADKEYMSNKDNWSIIIEGSHAVFCGIFALLSLYFKFLNNTKNFYITLSISMGTQLMNSILYMSEYSIQIKTPTNINYDSPKFPCGKYLTKRPFMYINIFWTLMPMYILFYELFC